MNTDFIDLTPKAALHVLFGMGGDEQDNINANFQPHAIIDRRSMKEHVYMLLMHEVREQLKVPVICVYIEI